MRKQNRFVWEKDEFKSVHVVWSQWNMNGYWECGSSPVPLSRLRIWVWMSTIGVCWVDKDERFGREKRQCTRENGEHQYMVYLVFTKEKECHTQLKPKWTQIKGECGPEFNSLSPGQLVSDPLCWYNLPLKTHFLCPILFIVTSSSSSKLLRSNFCTHLKRLSSTYCSALDQR